MLAGGALFYFNSGWYWGQAHFFHFKPEPQGQGSLRPILTTFFTGCFRTAPSPALLSLVTLATRSRLTG